MFCSSVNLRKHLRKLGQMSGDAEPISIKTYSRQQVGAVANYSEQ